ncbi:MAG: POTRA domain-containing protein [Planctomycetaceae bacterium]|nr:POTRA domain-containing protein [Planctomycetaceae bacterium]
MPAVLRDRLLRRFPVSAAAGWAVALACGVVACVGCQTGPLIRGQSPPVAAGGETGDQWESRPTMPDARQAAPRTLDLPPVDGPVEKKQARPQPGKRPDLSKQTLVAIVVEGNQSITTKDILRLLRLQPGRMITEAQVRDDVRRLFATRWFFSVEPFYRNDVDNPGGLTLVLRVVERPMIRAIRYEGNKHFDDEELTEATGLRIGSPYDISANREAVRKLAQMYRDKGFAFARVELVKGDRRGDRDVVFRVEEGQQVVVADVTFEGNNYRYATAGILRTKTKTKRAMLGVDLFGGKFKPETIPQDKQALLEYYRGLGFFDVKITHRVSTADVVFNPFRQGDGNLTIEYTISEGTQYKIRTVSLRGNKVFSTKTLADELQLTAGEFFNKRYLADDVRKMKDRYGRLGRLFARVEPLTRFDDSQPGVVDVIYEIDEDRPYLIGPIDVNFHGDNPHTKETVVLNRLLIQPGEVADPKLIRRSERRLAGMIFERGPMNGPRIRVRPMEPEELVPKRIPADPLSGLIPRTRFDRDVFDPSGLDRIDTGLDAVVSGPPFERGPELESEIFRAQSKEPIPAAQPYNPIIENSPLGDPFGSLGRALVDPNYGLLDVDIDVTEARTGRLMFGAGVNSDSGVVGSIVLDENNFDLLRLPSSMQDISDGTAWRGGGQRLRIEAMPGNYFSRYLLNWSDPYFLDTDFSLSVAGFYYQRFYFDWHEHRTGGRVTLGRQLTREWSLSGTLRLESVDIDNPDVPTPDLLLAALGETWFTSGRVSLAHDTRDNAFLPTEGHFLQASFEHAFGDFSFPQFRGDAKQYYTLSERPDGNGRQVLSLSSQVGWTGVDTPIYERFFAGGYQSFRGFDFRGVSPRQDGFPNTGIGGRFMALGSVQYQFPITADEMISGVVFTDFGSIEDRITLDDFRLTLGGGLRVMIPAMGPVPIAVDWGVPLVKQDFDDERMFSFYIGINR